MTEVVFRLSAEIIAWCGEVAICSNCRKQILWFRGPRGKRKSFDRDGSVHSISCGVSATCDVAQVGGEEPELGIEPGIDVDSIEPETDTLLDRIP